jgi:hypothetical protein
MKQQIKTSKVPASFALWEIRSLGKPISKDRKSIQSEKATSIYYKTDNYIPGIFYKSISRFYVR